MFQRIAALAIAAAAAVGTYADDYRIETLARDVSWPWCIAFLPDGDLLVTELDGQLRRIGRNGGAGPDITGVPQVYFAGQGGLFDVALHPQYARNRTIYLSYAEGSSRDNGTVVARATLNGNALEDVTVIFRVRPRKDTAVHYGGRMLFLPDDTLLLTSGDGFNYREAAQDRGSRLGKTLRMNDDGTPARDNPFPVEAPYVYTFGHRNPQGLAIAANGWVFLHEHGPRGGDEINILKRGTNYGWPAIAYGVDYNGAVVTPFTHWDGMAQPQFVWTPSIAPSGFAVYEGSLFPDWHGDLFVGALVDRELRQLSIRDNYVVAKRALLSDLGQRMRDVRVGPDGALYVAVDGPQGQILRLVPPE